jgi:Bacteriocin-protection, YdeI or OmpD-Associated/Domain of unknown function (DUF1905)
VVRFIATLRPVQYGTFVDVPPEVVEALRATGRTSVVGTVDGLPFTNQVMPYTFPGEGKKVILGVSKALRAATGKGAGDSVTFEIERDERSRSADVVVPTELLTALAADDVARAAWERLAPSHRREYAEWIGSAKRQETRDRRLADTLERLRG